MILKHYVDKYTAVSASDSSMDRDQMCHLAETVCEHQNTRSALIIGREPEDKVHRN